MSEMETHKGKLVPITNLPGVTTEDDAMEICNRLGLKRVEWHESWLECLREEGYEYCYYDGVTFYEKHDKELDPYGFSEITKNDDGTIDYFISWYNGGASMEEVLEEAIKNDSAD